jgi:2-polyprenyl-3-methyl-5-hydroxy-6-metoxy-1,4-benzoquinol methylase
VNQEKKNLMDEVYNKMSLEEIPWNMEKPPKLLVELVESGKVQPCRVIDLGCGVGNYAMYLAGKGFDVTGVDISPKAVEIANENAKKKSLTCNFQVADIVEGLNEFGQTWDFAYDWGVLHHILPEQRQHYVRNVNRILNPKGIYLSVSFSEKDSGFACSGKFRKTRIGSVLYFSSEEELQKLFEPYFQIIEIKTVEIEGKFTPHVFNYVFSKHI